MGKKDKPVFGVTENQEWSRGSQNDGKRAYDAASKRRQRLRSANAPEPLFFDDTPPAGRDRSGLIDRFIPKRRKE